MSEQKYTDEQYLSVEYFSDDDVITGLNLSLVKTRKEHECSSIFSDPHPIPIGSKAICESAIDADRGRVRNYICLNCANEYVEETGIFDYE